MGAFSQYTRHMVLDSLLRGGEWKPPKVQYMGLFTEAGDEMTGEGYVRKQVGPEQWAAVRADAGSDVERVTNDRLEWPAARGDWSGGAPIAGWRTFDAPEGGNEIMRGSFKPAKPVIDGDVYYIPPSHIVVELG